MSNNTQWIWKNGENRENTWMCFAKQIYLDNPPQEAVAKIAVDSKYWLYVNGVQVVFEGGLKRGPSKNAAYYHEVCIGSYLRHGSNKIAVLAWRFGKSGFSHLSSGMGGLLFEADLGGIMVLSDTSWKVMKHPAYVRADEGAYGTLEKRIIPQFKNYGLKNSRIASLGDRV